MQANNRHDGPLFPFDCEHFLLEKSLERSVFLALRIYQFLLRTLGHVVDVVAVDSQDSLLSLTPLVDLDDFELLELVGRHFSEEEVVFFPISFCHFPLLVFYLQLGFHVQGLFGGSS